MEGVEFCSPLPRPLFDLLPSFGIGRAMGLHRDWVGNHTTLLGALTDSLSFPPPTPPHSRVEPLLLGVWSSFDGLFKDFI